MIPKRVKVNRRYYTVEMLDQTIDYGGHKCRGLCDWDKKIIYISKKQTKRAIISTFLHELFHAICCEYKIKTLTHKAIYDIEGPLAAFFIHNPRLAKSIKQWRPQPAKKKGPVAGAF